MVARVLTRATTPLNWAHDSIQVKLLLLPIAKNPPCQLGGGRHDHTWLKGAPG